jgi:3',5'-cyclic AMP phosphodiesterase CpdA
VAPRMPALSSQPLILQISDPHFGTEQAHVVAALRDFVQRQAPALVVLSGDITQRARRSQFRAAADFVQQLSAAHVLAIPGNHDLPLFNPVARFFQPYANYARAFGTDLEPEYESERLLVLGVKTTRRLRHKDGEVSEAQIERIAQRLQRAKPEQLRAVVTHQPVHVIRERDIANLLRNSERAVRCWSDAGLDLFLGGHIHLPYVRPLHERFSDLSRAVWAVQAGTAVSRRIRDGVPNSINLIRYPVSTPNTCQVERWDFAAEARSFRAVETHHLQLDRTAPPIPISRAAGAASPRNHGLRRGGSTSNGL